MASIFSKVPVSVPNRSGFDMSHQNLFTGKVGTLYPICVDYLLPGDKISTGHSMQVQLPPMASDFYGKLNFKVEAFFVPYRLLYGGWQRVVENQPGNQTAASTSAPASLPFVTKGTYNNTGIGSLSDMLGIKGHLPLGSPQRLNIFPYLAYHRIYDDWYRDGRIQVPVFSVGGTLGSEVSTLSSLPYRVQSIADTSTYTLGDVLGDGVALGSLRQRNFSKDYFVNATAAPQLGNASSVSFEVTVDSDGEGSGAFSIASLRQANALQQWAERNQLAGLKYSNVIRAQYGVYPAGCQHCECIFLGSQNIPIYTKSVFQSTEASDSTTASSRNPYNTVGSKYGSSQGIDSNSLVSNFEAKEHGIFMVFGSLVPSRLYGSGTRRQMYETSVNDIPYPVLAGVGDQEILTREIGSDATSTNTFGYTQRYAHYKFMGDEVHGDLVGTPQGSPRGAGLLQNFALQTVVNNPTPTLSTSFIRIPDTYLNDVKAFAFNEEDEYGAAWNIDFWADSYFSYRKISTLPAYSLPTLGDMKNTHDVTIDNGGKRL